MHTFYLCYSTQVEFFGSVLLGPNIRPSLSEALHCLCATKALVLPDQRGRSKLCHGRLHLQNDRHVSVCLSNESCIAFIKTWRV